MKDAEVLPARETVRMLHGRHVWWDDGAVSMANITNKGGVLCTDLQVPVGGKGFAGGAGLGTVFPSASGRTSSFARIQNI